MTLRTFPVRQSLRVIGAFLVPLGVAMVALPALMFTGAWGDLPADAPRASLWALVAFGL